MHLSAVGYERLFSMDKNRYNELLAWLHAMVLRASSSGSSSGVEGGFSLQANHFKSASVRFMANMEMFSPSEIGLPVYVRRAAPVVYSAKGSASVSGSSSSGHASVKFDVRPVINTQVSSVVSVVLGNKKFYGAGAQVLIHTALPVEGVIDVSSKLKLNLVAKLPTQVQRDEKIELMHYMLKPFTVGMDVARVMDIARSDRIKVIKTGRPMKTVREELGRKVGISSKL